MKTPHSWPMGEFLTAAVRERPEVDEVENLKNYGENDYITLPALILDLDGTIRFSKSGEFIQGPDDIEIYADVEAKLLEYYPTTLIFGVSNQGGVAFGHKTPEQDRAEIEATIRMFDTQMFMAVFTAWQHPEGTVYPFNHYSLLRKPNYGMLVLCEWYAYQRSYIIDWNRSLIVGDRSEDKECAFRAGIGFEWTEKFFDRK
jgi:D-glycero-D-manno-heptose 1,7-bisphosphate phosphatase